VIIELIAAEALDAQPQLSAVRSSIAVQRLALEPGPDEASDGYP